MESVKIAGMLWADIVGLLVNIESNGTNMSVWPDVVAAPCGYWLVGEYQQTTAPSNSLNVECQQTGESLHVCIMHQG